MLVEMISQSIDEIKKLIEDISDAVEVFADVNWDALLEQIKSLPGIETSDKKELLKIVVTFLFDVVPQLKPFMPFKEILIKLIEAL